MDKDFGCICRYHHYLQPVFLRIKIVNLNYRYIAILCLFRNYKKIPKLLQLGLIWILRNYRVPGEKWKISLWIFNLIIEKILIISVY
jgi:hypothetical protein